MGLRGYCPVEVDREGHLWTAPRDRYELIGFVDAVLRNDEVAVARALLHRALGPDAVVDASGVIANFEMMNRIAEGTGIPVGKGSLERSEECPFARLLLQQLRTLAARIDLHEKNIEEITKA